MRLGAAALLEVALPFTPVTAALRRAIRLSQAFSCNCSSNVDSGVHIPGASRHGRQPS